MTQQESPFDNYPIEFKEINPQDFASFIVRGKTIITPNDEGYINEQLQANINLDEKSTTVINAGVGQGKTYSIIEIVKKYYDLEEYIIFIAPPYTSLIQQYYDSTINSGIPENQVYRYENIGTNLDIDPRTSRIQILTVNALLGNPGDNAILNSEAKRTYINTMVQYCRDSRKKVVFIYDEIHDAIHNFKEEYIFNLWKWRDVIHKNIIISATFNEASKVVIKYLANLTDKKIQLIESERKRIPEKQSELYLHFNNKNKYSFNDEGIIKIVQSLILKGKEIDILCYSKKLANDIYNSDEEGSIGVLLRSKFSNIQNCTSGLVENQRQDREPPINRFDPTKCNIGTNFKTGISIEKENHAFIIIMPPKRKEDSFKNYYGIFSDGINSIIQALARQRKKGEIHIILPCPSPIDYSTLPFSRDIVQGKFFKENYPNQSLSRIPTENYIKHTSINLQHEELRSYYSDIYRRNVENEIEFLNNQREESIPRLTFPSQDKFTLTHGEKYLTNNYFKADLSTIVTYYAITNQFSNCKLKEIYGTTELIINKGEILTDLEKFYDNIVEDNYYESALYYSYLYKINELKDLYNSSEIVRDEHYTNTIINETDREFYAYLKESLFNYFKVFLQEENGQRMRINGTNPNKPIEQAILTLYHRYRYSHYFNIPKTNSDYLFTRAEYFKANILHAINLQQKVENKSIEINQETQELMDAYLSMYYFISKINIHNIERQGIGTVQYIPFNLDESFIIEEDYNRFESMISTLITKDYCIANNVFDFKYSFNRTNYSERQKIEYLYNCLKKDFFSGERVRIRREASDVPLVIFQITDRFTFENVNLTNYPNFFFFYE